MSLLFSGILTFIIEPSIINTYITTILLGILTSALVSLIIYSVEYNVDKIKVLENFFICASELNNKMSKLDCLIFDEPTELIKSYYTEMLDNKITETQINRLPDGITILDDDDLFKLNNSVRKELTDYLKLTIYNELSLSDELTQQMAETSLDMRIDRYTKQILNIKNQYIELSKLSLKDVNNAYGNIYYFKNNKKRRNNIIYNDLLYPQRKMIYEIINAFGIQEYNNIFEYEIFTSLIYQILELQKKIFNYKVNDEVLIVNNKFCNDMSDKLEIFRASIYGDDPTFKNHNHFSIIPVPSDFINMKDSVYTSK